MRILVTGGTGFLGSHLCERLVQDGHRVVCLDNFYTGRRQNIQGLLGDSRFELVEGDVTKKINVTEIDRIYNLACPASPPAYQKDPIFTWRTSVMGMNNVLECARKNGNVPILQASTSEVYGDPLVHPQVESYWGNVNPIGIRSCYDEGKRAAESLCFDYYRKYQTPVRVVRIFNTYGPKMDPKDGRVVSNFVVRALLGEDVEIYGDGSQTRSFQYVSDLVEGMVRLMENKTGFTGPVNIGNPGEFRIKDFAEIVLKMIPESKSKIVYKELPSDDPKVRKPDITLAKKRLDWEPKVTLEQGLIPTIEYFRGEIISNQSRRG